MRKPRCKLIGTDGNIFCLLTKACKALRDADMNDRAKELYKRITTQCNSYAQALDVLEEYVDIR